MVKMLRLPLGHLKERIIIIHTYKNFILFLNFFKKIFGNRMTTKKKGLSIGTEP